MKNFFRLLLVLIISLFGIFCIWFVIHWTSAGDDIKKSEAYERISGIKTLDIAINHRETIDLIQGWKDQMPWPCSVVRGQNHASNYIARNINPRSSHLDRAFTSCRLEIDYTSSQLDNYFLIYAYVGQSEYGVETLAKTLFNKSLIEIELKEAIQIGLILKHPRLRDDKVNLEKRTQSLLEEIAQ